MEEALKRCTMCNKEKPKDAYFKNRTMRDGLQTYCKACAKAYQAQYSEKKFGEARARARARKAERQAELQRILAAKAARIPGEGLKRCSKCQEVKPVAEFNKSTHRPDGLQCQCKQCLRKSRERLRQRRIEERSLRPIVAENYTKQCTLCTEVKPATEFYSDKRAADGLQARCKKCHNAHKAPYRKSKADRREYLKAWRQKRKEAKGET